MNLSTYLQAGYPGLAVITTEEARAETEIAAVCASLNRQLHAWSSTEGLVDLSEGRITHCADPLDALSAITQSAPPDNHLLGFKVHHFRM